jgi:hypothetical protein
MLWVQCSVRVASLTRSTVHQSGQSMFLHTIATPHAQHPAASFSWARLEFQSTMNRAQFAQIAIFKLAEVQPWCGEASDVPKPALLIKSRSNCKFTLLHHLTLGEREDCCWVSAFV